MNEYYYNDFTIDNYKKIMQFASERYSFISYKDIENYRLDKEFILLRHDVDFSVSRSYALAKIEHELNISSTYFIQLGSEFYNIFEQYTKELIYKIIDLGHHIGLHFDPTQYFIESKADLERYILFEKELLEKLLNVKVYSFSFHNPTEQMLKLDDYAYSGLINSYSKFIKDKVEYCSDSNGYWRFKRLEEFLKKPEYSHKHILTHPGWWQDFPMSPFDRILRCVEGRARRCIENYESYLTKIGRKNVK